jgi:hypothetical protein
VDPTLNGLPFRRVVDPERARAALMNAAGITTDSFSDTSVSIGHTLEQ